MDTTSKVLIFLFAILVSYLVIEPFTDSDYKREVEVVASTYNKIYKDCPNKNGIELLKANYLLTVTSSSQRAWVEDNFNSVFYDYCLKFKKL